MKKCEGCGEVFEDEYRFCSSCGLKFKIEEIGNKNEGENIDSANADIIDDVELKNLLQRVSKENHELSIEQIEVIQERDEIHFKSEYKRLIREVRQIISGRHIRVICILMLSLISLFAAYIVKNNINFGEAGGGGISQYYGLFRNKNYIYYGYNNNGKSEFRKYDINTGKIKVMDNTVPSSMEFKDGWIYYIDALTRSMYKIKEDGTGKVRLIKGLAMDLVLFKNTIYYEENTENHKLWRVDTNGKSEENISDDILTYHIVGNKIYYSSAKDYGVVYRCNLDGSHKVKICKINGELMYVEKGYIYYKDIDDKELQGKEVLKHDFQGLLTTQGTICRVNLKGENREVLDSKNIIGGFNLVKNKIYYQLINGNEMQSWVMDLEGRYKTKLIENGFVAYIKVDTLINYEKDTKKVFISDLDGKNKKDISRLTDNQ